MDQPSDTPNANGANPDAGENNPLPALVDKAKQKSQEAADRSKRLVGVLADEARREVETRLNDRKDFVASGVETLAQALRDGSEQMRAQGQAAPARVLDMVAGGVAQFGGTLQNKEIDQIIRDTERFARDRPGVFLAAALAVGVVAGRFLKSSSATPSRGRA
jgi:ElaB/YqjD/DUF883 family membrane-anchored ribosome-binding protein